MSSLQEMIRNLLALQDIDTHIQAIRQELEDAPRRVARLEADLEKQETLLSQAKAEHDDLSDRREDLELRLEDHARKKRRTQAKAAEVRNARQHKAIFKEMDELHALKRDWEDDLLSILELLETLNATLASSQEATDSLRGELKAETSGMKANQANTEADLARLRKERQAYEAAIPPETMSQYDFIRSRLKDAAVAPVIGGICQLCHMRLPPQQFIELRQLKGLMNCPSCQRIIYWAEYDS
ncbi:MAG: hypothetical protein JRC92_11010 [Deltaproteobacteria bacterium]|nr:hypothetical protein [Deltaproteobacteria bacterium]